MPTRKYLHWATLLALAGTLFSGYLSLVRLRSGVCAFDEPCPVFLGRPACYTGFALFTILLALSLIALAAHVDARWPMIANAFVSAVGFGFAGRLTAAEWAASAAPYRMGLPACAWGFVFFTAVLLLSLGAWINRAWRRREARARRYSFGSSAGARKPGRSSGSGSGSAFGSG